MAKKTIEEWLRDQLHYYSGVLQGLAGILAEGSGHPEDTSSAIMELGVVHTRIQVIWFLLLVITTENYLHLAHSHLKGLSVDVLAEGTVWLKSVYTKAETQGLVESGLLQRLKGVAASETWNASWRKGQG